jgi:hypothetical protein
VTPEPSLTFINRREWFWRYPWTRTISRRAAPRLDTARLVTPRLLKFSSKDAQQTPVPILVPVSKQVAQQILVITWHRTVETSIRLALLATIGFDGTDEVGANRHAA